MGRKPRTSWPPCVRCRQSDGPFGGRKTPKRVSGARFGIAGQLCVTCYEYLRIRERRARDKPVPPLQTLATVVLGVRDALAVRDMATANERLREAVRLAEVVVAPATATRGDEGEA